MNFGKTEHFKQVDYTFEEEHPINKQKLQSSQKTKTTIHIGCTGWSVKEWKGTFYPLKAKTNQYLSYYSKLFSTVELNSTFYAIPSKEKINQWVDQVSPTFKFCPKFPKSISHSKDFGHGSGAIDSFIKALTQFGSTLGTSFLQLPEYYTPQKIKTILPTLRHLSSTFPVQIELRNKTFYESSHLQASIDLLNNMNLGWVVTDVAGRRDLARRTILKDKFMVRFVGNDDLETDRARLIDWADKCKEWSREGNLEIYFMIHQPDNIKAPDTVKIFIELFKDSDSIELKKMDTLVSQQNSLF